MEVLVASLVSICGWSLYKNSIVSLLWSVLRDYKILVCLRSRLDWTFKVEVCRLMVSTYCISNLHVWLKFVQDLCCLLALMEPL